MDPLTAERLVTRLDPARLPFETTEEVEGVADAVGQERALEALEFGLGVGHDGYNVFVMGPPGIGKRWLSEHVLAQWAAGRGVPQDWCYVYNFDLPHRPWAIALEPGQGAAFQRDMERLVEDLRTQIPAAFESEEYRARAQEIEEEFKERQEQAVREVADEAASEGLRLLRTPAGFMFAPVRDDEVIEPESFAKLPADEQERIKAKIDRYQERLQGVMRQVVRWGKDSRSRLKQLSREVALAAVGYLIAEVKKKYGGNERIEAFLDRVEADVLEHVDEFRQSGGRESAIPLPIPVPFPAESRFERYRVNLLVDRSGLEGAPVVFEDHPSYHNLVGRVEHRAQMGALTTDFTLIKPGSLHRANGGCLVVDARKVLMQPYAWEALKGALQTRQVRIESLGEMLSIVSTVSLEPEYIPLDVKVVLLGDRMLYYLLHQLDPDFGELFKVCADFEDTIDRGDEAIDLYVGAIASAVRKHELRHLDRGAVARVIEQLSREAGDAEKLTLHMRTLTDLLREADHWAGKDGRDIVTVGDVERAIDAATKRVDRVRNLVHEQIERGTVLIDTSGEKVGQINGLSVLSLGNFRFGQPSRITATARIGKGEVIDIEREVKLGGPTHSKGVLILSNFIASRYARTRPLSLSASLVFEQSYGMVDGDSASVAETCALLSALADVPIRQSIAVTGSINQRGEVQAIGGVNEKIEGFFDVCRRCGVESDFGVIIPAANVKHLMLRSDVVEAAREGRFRVWAVSTIDEALELLTGLEAGVRGDDGRFPEGSVNRRVEDRLEELLAIRRRLAAEEREEGRNA